VKYRYKRDPCRSHIAHWLANQGYGYRPQRSEAERFLKGLDPSADAFSFRTFSDTEYTRTGSRDPLEKAIHGTLDACWEQLKALNRLGAAISVTINRTNGKGRENTDIVRVRALFLDDDSGGDPERFPIKPHIQVETSPGHYHHYWLVDHIALEHFSTFQLGLAMEYQGDSRVQALNQSMQLPGFWRRKGVNRPGRPRLSVVRSHAPYPYHELERLIDTA
jgi:hypothetical protein